MDFDKILSQRGRQAAAINPEVGERILAAKEKVRSEQQAKAKPKQTRNRAKDAESKRSTWKLKGLYLRPETAKRLRSYVNRLQEDDQKIDASDVVDQALAAFLDKKKA